MRGITLLPDQPGPVPHLAVAAGKNGQMFFLNRDNLGVFTPGGPNKVLGQFTIGACWCGASYFLGADGMGRVVSSGGNRLGIWKLATSPSPKLSLEHTSSAILIGQAQDPGFFTTVSSNGNRPA